MSSVTSGSETYREYSWRVPSYGSGYANIGDVQDAIAFATSAAQTLGIDTSKDDWLQVKLPADDELVFYFAVKESDTAKPKPTPRCMTMSEGGYLQCVRPNGHKTNCVFSSQNPGSGPGVPEPEKKAEEEPKNKQADPKEPPLTSVMSNVLNKARQQYGPELIDNLGSLAAEQVGNIIKDAMKGAKW